MQKLITVMDCLEAKGITKESAAAIVRQWMQFIMNNARTPEELTEEVFQWAQERNMVQWAK